MTRRTSVDSIKSALLGALLLVIVTIPAQAQLISGNIAIYNGNTLLGYVSNTYDAQNFFTYTTDTANALQVQFDSSASAPFSITSLNPPGSNPNFGAVGGAVGYYFASSQVGYAYLTGTSFVPANSPPSSSATNDIQPLGYDGPSESTIWSRSGNVLHAQWVNADGTKNPTQLFYDPTIGYLGITGDLTSFNNTFGENAQAVTLRFTGSLTPVPAPSSLALFGAGMAVLGSMLIRKSPRIRRTA